MPKAGEVAAELRRVADAFDKQPETEVVRPMLNFYHGYDATKEIFLALAALFPRPFEKGDGFSHDELTLTHTTDALIVKANIDRSKICVLVRPAQPAEYECEPLLSQAEEDSLTTV